MCVNARNHGTFESDTFSLFIVERYVLNAGFVILGQVGNRNRSKEATEANEVSSRSHAVLQVQVEIKEMEQGIDEEVRYAKLSMVDLAGSERAANTSNRGIRMLEGAKIN